jgi:aminopeptidase N
MKFQLIQLVFTFIAFASLAAFPVLAADERKAWIDVQSYAIEVELNDTSDKIVVKETVVFDWRDTKKTPYFDLIQVQKNGKGMVVKSVSEKGRQLQFIHDQNRLLLTGLQFTGSSTIELEFRFEGIPADGLIIGKNKFDNRTFFGDNWPNRAHNWFACVDHPADKATIEWKVIAPDKYKVIANGQLMDQKLLSTDRTFYQYKSDIPLPTKVMVIGVADFSVNEMPKAAGVPLSSWVYPESAESAIRDLNSASEIIPFFVEYIARYPYEKLANVQSTTRYGGMENASCIFYDENALNGKGKVIGLVAHEIAHQWFGNSASEADWEHIWLSEGFATYFTHLYTEHAFGKEEMKNGLRADRNKIIAFQKKYNRPVVDPSYDDINNLLNPLSYQKGSWVLHMLRNEMGDQKFQEGIRLYYNKFQFSNASTDQFREIMEMVYGKSLQPFFNQWLFNSQHPVLKCTATSTKKMVTLEIEQQTDPLTFTIDVAITLKNGTQLTKAIHVSKKKETITIPVNSAMSKIDWDPEVNLLFETVD